MALGVRQIRRLRDYPLNEWMEAADACEHCGEKALVMVTWVDGVRGLWRDPL